MISGSPVPICSGGLGNALLHGRKKVQITLYLGGALSHSGQSRLGGGHSTTPGRASDIHSLPGCKEDTPAQWGAVVAYDTPAVPMLSAAR